MIKRLVDEIEICIQNKCYISALTMTITLPDICGRAEYPEEKATGKRFKQWYKKYAYSEEAFGIRMLEDVVYSLRCKLLHEGNPAIDNAKYKVKKFALIIRENSANIPLESSESYIDDDGRRIFNIYNVNLIELCRYISNAAMRYYRDNSGKFDFFDYRITNTTDDKARMFGLTEDILQVNL